MFSVAPSVGFGQIVFEYNFYPIYFFLLLTNFIYIRDDASIDIVDDEGCFEFSHKTGFKPPLNIHISIDTEAESLHTLAAVLEIC